MNICTFTKGECKREDCLMFQQCAAHSAVKEVNRLRSIIQNTLHDLMGVKDAIEGTSTLTNPDTKGFQS